MQRILYVFLCLVLPFLELKAQNNNCKIHPQVQNIKYLSGKINISGGVNLKNKKRADCDAVSNLLSRVKINKKAIKLYIGEISDSKMSKFKSSLKHIDGAYYLSVNKNRIIILGYNERGIFYGVNTFLQLLSSGGDVSCVEIHDYPDVVYRGVVEGFYGNPWSHKNRISQLKFYGQNKLNTYIYGPKDDPYHSSPNWRKEYPKDQAFKISELCKIAKQNKVDFVWAIHPGKDIKWNEEDYVNLKNKFQKMYDLGVRAFAIFFDDISGNGTDCI